MVATFEKLLLIMLPPQAGAIIKVNFFIIIFVAGFNVMWYTVCKQKIGDECNV